MTGRRVVVVGGGLAGITTALQCADAGCDVTLLEAKPWLGGLTHSFRRGDLMVDNGQHVFMRCCTSYRRLLERLRVSEQVALQPRLDVPVRSADTGRTARIRRDGLPAPLHLGRALATYRWLSFPERARALRAALALRSVDLDDPATDDQTFADWLGAHAQTRRSIETLWELIGVATLNAHADQASLSLAAMVFQVGLLSRYDAGDIGWSRVPLGELHGEAAARALTAAGATVRTHARVENVSSGPQGWTLHLDDEEVFADDVVVATPPTVTEALLPAGTVPQSAGWSKALGSSPIVNLHVVYDRAVLEEPFLAAVDSPLQFVFDRTGPSGCDSGQYLAVSMSAADGLVDQPVAEVRDLLVPELARLLPASRDARVREAFVTRERQATFRPAPGTARLRPATRTRTPGLYLAGAWTATGWPATMEGAVRSGESAAEALLGSDTLPRREVAA